MKLTRSTTRDIQFLRKRWILFQKYIYNMGKQNCVYGYWLLQINKLQLRVEPALFDYLQINSRYEHYISYSRECMF